MFKWIGRALLLLLALLLSWVLLAWSHWLPRLDLAQQAALILLRTADPAPNTGVDGFADLWALRLQVPPEQRAALLAADAARINGLAPGAPALSLPGAFPERELPTEESLKTLCRGQLAGAECLAHLRLHREAARAVLTRHQDLIDALDGVLRADRWHSPFLPTVDQADAKQAGLGLQFDLLLRNRAGLQHLDGDSANALQVLCAEIVKHRRLRAGTAVLLLDQLGLLAAGSRLDLLVAIRNEMTTADPLPPVCTAALAPMADAELDGCPTARRHFRAIERLYASTEATGTLLNDDAPRWQRWLYSLLWQSEHTLALHALKSAPFCEVRAGAALRDPQLGADTGTTCANTAVLFNGAGCMAATADVGLNHYHQRRLLLDAWLQRTRAAML